MRREPPAVIRSCRRMGVSALGAIDELFDLLHENDRDLFGIVVGLVWDRLTKSDDDRNVALEVLRSTLREDALTPPHRSWDQRCSCRHRHPGSSGLTRG